MSHKPLVVLLTDYGTSDAYVGILKGVLAQLAPGIPVIDLTHEVPPGDIRQAAFLLWQSKPYFPSGTIFLGVVDPGVGTSRQGILVRSGDYIFVGPDNGIFSYILESDYQAWELRNPAYTLPNPGLTFHGRDIFAPAVAYSALGVAGEEFGPSLNQLVSLPPPRMEFTSQGSLYGEIMYIDHFGNLVTSLGKFNRQKDILYFEPWQSGVEKNQFSIKNTQVHIKGNIALPWARTFQDIPANQCAALVGSSGLLEIVAYQASAEMLTGLQVGEMVTLN